VRDGVHGQSSESGWERAGRIANFVEQASMLGQPRPADAGPAGSACCIAPKIANAGAAETSFPHRGFRRNEWMRCGLSVAEHC
jgi:hypothetical protein